MSLLVLPLLPFCSTPKGLHHKGGLHHTDIMSHMQEPAQILFCLPAPPSGSGFMASAALHRQTLQSRVFSARLRERGL